MGRIDWTQKKENFRKYLEVEFIGWPKLHSLKNLHTGPTLAQRHQKCPEYTIIISAEAIRIDLAFIVPTAYIASYH